MLLFQTKEELPAPSIEAGMLVMGALDSRGRERQDDEGTLVRLCVDSDMTLALLELNDPTHFNSFSYALGEDFLRVVHELLLECVVFPAVGKEGCKLVSLFGHINTFLLQRRSTRISMSH